MPFKSIRPEWRARNCIFENSTVAQNYYHKEQAKAYTTDLNARIQSDLTDHAFLLVTCNSEKTLSFITILDIGAGSGLSTNAAERWADRCGISALILAFDVSHAMLSAARHPTCSDANNAGFHALTSRFCANAAHKFPLLNENIDLAIGISMLQWLENNELYACLSSLNRVLNNLGECIFQLYPTSSTQVQVCEDMALKAGFSYAEVFVSFPHSTPAKKWYFIVSKHRYNHAVRYQCMFGRRYSRRCAWHLLPDSDQCMSRSIETYRNRLIRAHVKEIWHIWRKWRRIEDMGMQRLPGPVCSMRPGDLVIVQAIRDLYTCKSGMSEDLISYELLYAHGSAIVDLSHKAFTVATSLE